MKTSLLKPFFAGFFLLNYTPLLAQETVSTQVWPEVEASLSL
jgi:hypothetical protein